MQKYVSILRRFIYEELYSVFTKLKMKLKKTMPALTKQYIRFQFLFFERNDCLFCLYHIHLLYCQVDVLKFTQNASEMHQVNKKTKKMKNDLTDSSYQ